MGKKKSKNKSKNLQDSSNPFRNYHITYGPVEDLPEAVDEGIDEFTNLIERGSPQLAIARLNILMAQYPSVPILHSLLNYGYMKTHEVDKLERGVKEAYRLFPDYLIIRMDMAHHYILTGEFEKAVEVLGKDYDLQALYPNRKSFHITEFMNFYNEVITLLFAKGELKKAKKFLKGLSKVAPNHPDVSKLQNQLKKKQELFNRLEKLKEEVEKFEEYKKLSTEEIFKDLRKFDIDLTEEQFIEETKKFEHSTKMSVIWEEKYPKTKKNVDFIWQVILELRTRLLPDFHSYEEIEMKIQDGYMILEEGNTIEACNLWLEVWEYTKERFSSVANSVEKADELLQGTLFIYNWVSDLEMELLNAGLEDSSFYEKAIQFFQEFCEIFPETDAAVLLGMKRSEADCYFALGKEEKADELFHHLIEQSSTDTWSYIRWGDCYASKNPQRALEIYNLGLEKCTKDKNDLISRIEGLQKPVNPKNPN